MENVTGKVAFITGGASGIGLGIAKVFVKNGMKVVIADMRQDALDAAVVWFSERGQRESVHAVNVDITDREAYARAADEAEAAFRKLHVLVNNAGVGSGGPLEKLTYKDWDYSMAVNVGGVINGIMTIVPRIIGHGEGGHVVSTSSTCGLMGTPGMAVYCTTKYAVTGMMEALAGELAEKNIGVSVLYPGLTKTNLGESSFVNRPAHLRNEGETWPPQPRNGDRPRHRPSADFAMDPVETGERVLRGIRRNDLFIHTHPEWRAGYQSRHDAIMRAIPDEPRDEKRWDIFMGFGKIIYNDVYDRQQPVGPPDW